MAKAPASEIIRLPLPLPMKGINQNFSRSAQPEATCWDALNVLPIDRQGRLRIALRGGTREIEQIGGTSKVRLVHVASTIGGGSNVVFDEPFTYSDGVLDVVSTLTWTSSYTDVSHSYNPAVNVSSNSAVWDFDDGVSNRSNIITRQLAGISATAAYDITMYVRFYGTRNATRNAGITVTLDGNTGTAFQAIFDAQYGSFDGDNDSTVELLGWDGTDDAHFDGLLLTYGVDYVLKISVFANGDVKLYVDGVEKASVTGARDPTTVTFSDFAFQGFSSTSSGVSVDRIVMTTTGGGNQSVLKLVATSGADTYIGTDPTSMSVVSNSGSYPIDSAAQAVSAATLFLKTYIVDGANIRQLNLVTEQFEAYAATDASTAPVGCTIAVGWRGRLVLSGDSTDPQNVFASKSGDPTNWNYAVDPPTETMAWAANAANLGKIGEPVLALIPLSDDILLIGCEQSIWAVRGDIAADGSIDNITEGAGIISQSAWCRSADGNVYFIGPNGLYRANPDGSAPVEISRDVFRQFFRGINRITEHVTLVFDKERYGVWILVTPEDSGDAPVRSLFYDIRLDGYWPIEFTNIPDAGPIHAAYWDGLDADTRYPVLGSYTGSLYSINFSDRFDNDGSDHQIPGYVVMGPVSLSNVDDAILTKFDVTSGELGPGDSGVFEMKWTARGGPSANSVTEGTPLITATGTFIAGDRAQTQYPRVRGGWISMKFENGSTSGDYFSLENVVLHILPAGTQRV